MAVLGAAAAAGGGAISNFPITFAKSCTWACPVVMEAYVFVIGGGGSGAAGSTPNATYRIQGGTAGGCAVSKLSLKAQNYTVVVGAGGAQVGQVEDTYAAGANGNDSSFDNDGGTAITQMVGVKGLGGAAATSGNNLSALAGGSASGGNLMNNTGGGVVAITADQTVTAGGAVGLWEAGREGQSTTNGLVDNPFMGDDGISSAPGGSEWGQTGPWYIPPLNAASTVGEYSGYSNYVLYRAPVPAGMKSTDHRGQHNSSSPANYTDYAWFAGPFSGGVGNSSNHQWVSAGGGSLGGGGGGIISRHSGSGYVAKSGGGTGGVIIIPISLGS